MTNTTNDREHIRAAAELLAAKARRRLELLQQRVAASPALAPEIEELERITRLAAGALSELDLPTTTDETQR